VKIQSIEITLVVVSESVLGLLRKYFCIRIPNWKTMRALEGECPVLYNF